MASAVKFALSDDGIAGPDTVRHPLAGDAGACRGAADAIAGNSAATLMPMAATTAPIPKQCRFTRNLSVGDCRSAQHMSGTRRAFHRV
jgi:hypothetical protein